MEVNLTQRKVNNFEIHQHMGSMEEAKRMILKVRWVGLTC